jgi:hypothetical protein
LENAFKGRSGDRAFKGGGRIVSFQRSFMGCAVIVVGLSGAFAGGIVGGAEGMPLLGALAGAGLFAGAVYGIGWVTGAFRAGNRAASWVPSGGTDDSAAWLSTEGDGGGDIGGGDAD